MLWKYVILMATSDVIWLIYYPKLQSGIYHTTNEIKIKIMKNNEDKLKTSSLRLLGSISEFRHTQKPDVSGPLLLLFCILPMIWCGELTKALGHWARNCVLQAELRLLLVSDSLLKAVTLKPDCMNSNPAFISEV